MSAHDPHPSELPLRIFLIAAAATAMAAVILWATREPVRSNAAAPTAGFPTLAPPQMPIASEADVFRTTAGALALGLSAPRLRSAHPRSLATFRFLRAYPGAPPRIPHALTPAEFRTGACRTCHERGGYSTRFAAYVPVTPHPEMGMCLQCHPGDDGVMGIGAAGTDPNARCPQCHGPNGTVASEARLTWGTSVWPRPSRSRPDSAPLPIPHDRTMRGNCLACHGGPAAVAEIRTAHPERTGCRGCHVEAEPGVGEFRRPTADPESDSGGGS